MQSAQHSGGLADQCHDRSLQETQQEEGHKGRQVKGKGNGWDGTSHGGLHQGPDGILSEPVGLHQGPDGIMSEPVEPDRLTGSRARASKVVDPIPLAVMAQYTYLVPF